MRHALRRATACLRRKPHLVRGKLLLPAGQGGVPNRHILDRLGEIGYDGDVSLELFDTGFEAQWHDDPVAAARMAYERCTALERDVWPQAF